MSESVANANAQMNSADAAQGGIGDSAKAMSQAMSAKASTILLAAADNQADGRAPAEGAAVATPDQLNDVDKVLQESHLPDRRPRDGRLPTSCLADGCDGTGQTGAAGKPRSGIQQ